MRRYIVTGAPGAGKTTIVDALRERGYPAVREAATDVIAREQRRGRTESWSGPGFIDAVVGLQRRRQLMPAPEGPQVFDRSPICTLALARYVGHPVTTALAAEIERIISGRIYRPTVFFVRLLGFMTNTAARRITLEQSKLFEEFHERAYGEYGFDLVEVPAGPLADRVQVVERHLE